MIQQLPQQVRAKTQFAALQLQAALDEASAFVPDRGRVNLVPGRWNNGGAWVRGLEME